MDRGEGSGCAVSGVAAVPSTSQPDVDQSCRPRHTHAACNSRKLIRTHSPIMDRASTSAVWRGVVRCGCGVVPCSAMRCGAVRCDAMPCGAVWRCATSEAFVGAARRAVLGFAATGLDPTLAPASRARACDNAGPEGGLADDADAGLADDVDASLADDTGTGLAVVADVGLARAVTAAHVDERAAIRCHTCNVHSKKGTAACMLATGCNMNITSTQCTCSMHVKWRVDERDATMHVTCMQPAHTMHTASMPRACSMRATFMHTACHRQHGQLHACSVTGRMTGRQARCDQLSHSGTACLEQRQQLVLQCACARVHEEESGFRHVVYAHASTRASKHVRTHTCVCLLCRREVRRRRREQLDQAILGCHSVRQALAGPALIRAPKRSKAQ